MQEIAQSRVQRPALCYIVARRDGQTLAITNASKVIPWSGWRFIPTASAQDSAVEQETGMAPGTLDLGGVISSDLITDDDLDAGRYNDARITRYLFDFEHVWLGPLTTDVFHVATVERTGSYWTAQTTSLAGKLDRKVGGRYQRTCDHPELGDPVKCRADIAPLSLYARAITAVDASAARRVCTVDTALGSGFATDRFTFGKLIVRRGNNHGISRKIAAWSDSTKVVQLASLMPLPLEVGDVVDLIVGCARDFITCRDDFGNAINFGGNDRMPGPDEILKPATS
ncbi:hypothetical protein Pla86_28050 [Planctomycetes bacterium Pla86]|uniref:Bacteriophage phiJL001 Gp84 C-terminal domain-containing protein n=2 Tax=Engelhardtia mirabilis TaxID=2528011 RepID=A0A518BL80_9BACT|nr:hypothetical protein Pla133_28060 [Planctomycetes bacterium Pla133]QDV02044.1 hypothetical protein Pla86_28050 [Planctomycetes bacterium Pla86]